MNKIQLTFAIIKPHAVKNPFAMEQIRQQILDHQFQIVKNKKIQFTNQLAEKFYNEHKLKFFYNRLHTFMCRFVYSALYCELRKYSVAFYSQRSISSTDFIQKKCNIRMAKTNGAN